MKHDRILKILKLKKTILLFLISLIAVSAPAQTAISVLYTPMDRGVGLRVDKQIEDYGLYSSVSYGNYKYAEAFVNDHFRLTAGAVKYLDYSYVGAGISYNSYGDYQFLGKIIDRALIPVSLELCSGVRIGNMIFGLAVDLLKYDIGINIGIVLK